MDRLDRNPLRSGSPEYGKLRTDLSCANEQVVCCLREHPDEIYQMSPREFEPFTAAMLELYGVFRRRRRPMILFLLPYILIKLCKY